jgi:anti-anti-sigma factor
MKCYEIAKCGEQERKNCYVWNSFQEHPEDFENVRCWVVKGAYQGENKEFLKKCLACEYYKRMNQEPGVSADTESDLATITCEGAINNNRSKAIQRIWEMLKKHGKYNVVLDLAKTTNIYSCGFSSIIQMHKEAKANKGLLAVVCAGGHVKTLFESVKLSRLLCLVDDRQQALQAFSELRKKQEQERRPAPRPAPEKIPRCFEFWNNRNPQNATTCDECWRKARPSEQHCWMVEGNIEGVSFQYVNEDCEACGYYLKYSPVAAAKGQE